MCRTCKKKCDDIPKHMVGEHKFTKEIVALQIKAKANCYENFFEKLE